MVKKWTDMPSDVTRMTGDRGNYNIRPKQKRYDIFPKCHKRAIKRCFRDFIQRAERFVSCLVQWLRWGFQRKIKQIAENTFNMWAKFYLFRHELVDRDLVSLGMVYSSKVGNNAKSFYRPERIIVLSWMCTLRLMMNDLRWVRSLSHNLGWPTKLVMTIATMAYYCYSYSHVTAYNMFTARTN